MNTIGAIFLTLALVTLVTANGQFRLQPRIVGGQKAIAGQFPYQVSLRDRVFRYHHCGASILNERYLLTAAHCTMYLYSQPIFMVAVVGTVHHRFGGVTYSLSKIIRHKEYSTMTNINDISLIRTVRKIKFTPYIAPIGLPTQNDPGNTAVILSGWGQTSVSSNGIIIITKRHRF